MSPPLSPPLPLSVEHLPGSGSVSRRALFLHGMLGRGNNLRSLARRFVDARPGWDALLLDLRGHGASPKGTPNPSLAAAAGDVLPLCLGRPQVTVLIGHSFGGKVALEVARLLHQGDPSTAGALAHVVTLDTNPGVRRPDEIPGQDSVVAVLQVLSRLAPIHPSRAAFIDALLQAGLSRMLAQWLAQSTESSPAAAGAVRFALDLDELRGLLQNYFASDLWPFLTQPPPGLQIHLVIGERSTSYSPDDRQRAQALSATSLQVTVDRLPTDHWVHAEDPEGVLRVLAARLPS